MNYRNSKLVAGCVKPHRFNITVINAVRIQGRQAIARRNKKEYKNNFQ
jgi:hypothetical protein